MEIPPWVFGGLLIFTVILFYLPVLNNGFVGVWDDSEMITDNPYIRSLGFFSISRMLTTGSGGLWVPLTFFSFALNYWVGGLDPRIFHLTNLIFHALNTLLVFQVCKRVLDWGYANREKSKEFSTQSFALPKAFLVALIFGLHPIHVESVAWAAERKDVLYAFFYLLGLMIYLGNPSLGTTSLVGESKAPENKIRTWNLNFSKLFILLGLYLLALMSKPMAVTLPLVFLILDFWPLKRLQDGFSKVLMEKIPFLLVALMVSLVTKFGMSQINRINNNLPLLFRIAHVFHSFIFYLWKMIAPFQLVPIYPFPHIVDNIYYSKAAFEAILVTLLSIGVFLYRKKYPYLAAAWLYYLITLIPVIGFIQVGSFAAGDRYTYLPCLGLFLPFSAGITTLFSRRFMFFWFFCLVLGLVLGFATTKQIGVWKDEESVSACVTRAYPVETCDSEIRYGDDLYKKGKVNDALKHFKKAGAILPLIATPHERMGTAYMVEGRMDEAIGEFKEALEINNNSKEYPSSYLHNQLWTAYERSGQKTAAFAEAQEFQKENPNESSAYYEMGIVYFEEKEYSKAVNYLKLAIQLEPNNKFYSDTLTSILSKAEKTK